MPPIEAEGGSVIGIVIGSVSCGLMLALFIGMDIPVFIEIFVELKDTLSGALQSMQEAKDVTNPRSGNNVNKIDTTQTRVEHL